MKGLTLYILISSLHNIISVFLNNYGLSSNFHYSYLSTSQYICTCKIKISFIFHSIDRMKNIIMKNNGSMTSISIALSHNLKKKGLTPLCNTNGLPENSFLSSFSLILGPLQLEFDLKDRRKQRR
jgi:hypothetical protein